jgi:hypothetical protein
MSEDPDERADEAATASAVGDTAGASEGESDAEADSAAPDTDDLEALRQQVEDKYDFEDFRPADMAEMSAEEWEAAFDPETWITGEELLDRVEADLKNRVAQRDVFARIERFDDHIIAYSDTGYATVYGDGSVEGRGTVLRDVKPTVALASMESYEVPDPPDGDVLPEPTDVPQGSGDFGNRVLQVVAGFQILAGIVLLGAWVFVSLDIVSLGGTARQLNAIAMLVAGLGFIIVGIFLFTVVANARLSDKFRAEEYRNRLRAVDLEDDERPEFLPEGVDIEELASGREGSDEESATGASERSS